MVKSKLEVQMTYIKRLLGFLAVVFLISTVIVSCAAAADHATFVGESIPKDRDIVDAGTSFTKTWTFKNDGDVDWVGYKLYLTGTNINPKYSQYYLNYPTYVSIPNTPHGKSVTISVTLQVPSIAFANQESTWNIKNKAAGLVSGGIATLKFTVNPKQGTNIPNLRHDGYSKSTNPLTKINLGGQCTAFAWGRAFERTGKSLPAGDAYTWYGATPTTDKGTIPMEDSVAVWGYSKTYPQGHVAYVEKITGNNILINEGNYFSSYGSRYPITSWGGGYDGKPYSMTRDSIGSHLSPSALSGYIYLINKPLSISPAIGPRGTTFTFTGKGYRPNSQIEWHVKNPKGVELVSTLPASNIDSSGNLRFTYVSKTTDITGKYTVWAVDKSRGTSNVVTETIT